MTAVKRKKILSGIGGIAIFIMLYFLYEHIRYIETDNAQIEAHWVMMAPRVGGYINKVNVIEGQKVNHDDVLVEIDDRDYQSMLTQAKSNLVSVEAKRSEAEKNYKRISQLYSQGAVTQQQFDVANSSYSEVKAKYDSLSAQMVQAELNLENSKLKAPFDGFISKKSAEVGQLATPGVPLIGFVSSSERWVNANVKETDLESIKVGAKVDIEVDGVSSKSFKGFVESISAATGSTFALLPPDNATGNFTKVVQRVPVKIKMENLSEDSIALLKVGLSAVVKIHK
ncbi:MAG: HlyD family secretion protein [Bdellovibrionales bacterium]